MKLGPNQTRWLEALESGQWEQGAMYLNRKGKFCCLGVAAELFKTEEAAITVCQNGVTHYDAHSKVAPGYVISSLGLFDAVGSDREGEKDSLAAYNDQLLSFEWIARKIRGNPEKFFKEPK